MKTKNKKVNEFQKTIFVTVAKMLQTNERIFNEKIDKIKNLSFERFDNVNPISECSKNKIYFTKNNHYPGNRPISFSLGQLRNPHTSFEDRGYYKGVAVDLENYLILKSLKFNKDSTLEYCLNLYKPSRLRSAKYKLECDTVVNQAAIIVNSHLDRLNEKLSSIIKNITGCSLLWYLDCLNPSI